VIIGRMAEQEIAKRAAERMEGDRAAPANHTDRPQGGPQDPLPKEEEETLQSIMSGDVWVGTVVKVMCGVPAAGVDLR
jgi:hypothetical protein